jgi:hypothetical protein
MTTIRDRDDNDDDGSGGGGGVGQIEVNDAHIDKSEISEEESITSFEEGNHIQFYERSEGKLVVVIA